MAHENFSSWIPKALSSSWCAVVERAGYRTIPFHQSYWDKLYTAGELPNSGDALSRRVRWYSLECDVYIREDSSDQTPRWIASIVGEGEELAGPLARIFMASGASPALRPAEFQRLHRCDKGRAHDIIRQVVQSETKLRLSSWHSIVGDGVLGINSYGEIRVQGAIVRFYTGPSLDPDTGEDADYIAIGKAPRFFGFAGSHDILADISAILTQANAKQVEITLSRLAAR